MVSSQFPQIFNNAGLWFRISSKPLLNDVQSRVPSLSPSEVPPKFVTAKCDYFVDVQLWPPHKLRPEAWLANFRSDELPFALHLLNAFLYYSDHFLDQLFVGAFQGLSELLNPVTRAAAAAAIGVGLY